MHNSYLTTTIINTVPYDENINFLNLYLPANNLHSYAAMLSMVHTIIITIALLLIGF